MFLEPGHAQCSVLALWKYVSCPVEHLAMFRTSQSWRSYLEGSYGKHKGCTLLSPWDTLMGYRKESKTLRERKISTKVNSCASKTGLWDVNRVYISSRVNLCLTRYLNSLQNLCTYLERMQRFTQHAHRCRVVGFLHRALTQMMC